MASGFASSNVVSEARRYLGGNPTGRGSLWCARFTNMVLQHSGYRGTGSDMASSFAKYGQRVSGPQVGAIAVMSRGRRGGHVGIITGVDASGQSDHDLGQQRQPCPRGPGVARPDLRLRHADELSDRNWTCKVGKGSVPTIYTEVLMVDTRSLSSGAFARPVSFARPTPLPV